MSNGQQLIVNGTTLPTVLATVLRQGILLLGSFAIGSGWVDEGSLEGIATAIVTLATVGYGLYVSWCRKKQLIKTANAAPDSVAIVTNSKGTSNA